MNKQNLRRYNDGIIFIFEGDIEKIVLQREQEFSERGGKAYILHHPDGQPFISMRLFFDAVQHSLPKAHEVQYGIGGYWSALSDVLWQGFDALDIEWVDIVWKDADFVAEKSLPTLVHGLVFLKSTLEGVRKDVGARHNLYPRIILTSKNRNAFKDWFIER